MVRSPQQTARVKELLRAMTGEALASPEGKILRQILTAEEEQQLRDIPVVSDPPPGFNGVTCDMCREYCRLNDCPKCHGSFEGLQGNS